MGEKAIFSMLAIKVVAISGRRPVCAIVSVVCLPDTHQWQRKNHKYCSKTIKI
jgi:hypothetical protein